FHPLNHKCLAIALLVANVSLLAQARRNPLRIAEHRLTPRSGSRESKPCRGPSTRTAVSTSSIPIWAGISTNTSACSSAYLSNQGRLKKVHDSPNANDQRASLNANGARSIY